MENAKNDHDVQSDEYQKRLQDAFLCTEILKKVLELRPMIREGIVGDKWINLSRDEKIQEMLTPRFTFFFVDLEKKVPAFFLRFVDTEPVLEASFYPYPAMLVFLDEARTRVESFQPPVPDQKAKDEIIHDYTLEMTLILVDNIYRRVSITSDSFPLEVIGQWRNNKKEEIVQFHSERGEQIPAYKETLLDLAINTYRKEILAHWKYQGQTRDNWRKVWLADEYEGTYNHWNLLLKLFNDERSDWREYAKAGKFQDTPDDLLNKLMDVDRSSEETTKMKVSELAIEHAARRVGLIKKRGIGEFARKKRKDGITISDYSSQQLFNFLKEGREIRETVKKNQEALAKIETEPSFMQIDQAALIEKQKVLEQKIDFIQKESEKQLEQRAQSAQAKNS
jgi:hypothetical protein